MQRNSLILLCSLLIAFEKLQHLSCASYEVTLERVETAFGEDDKVFRFDTLRIKKFNRTTFVVNGVFTVKRELGEDIDIYAAGLNLQGGQYKKIMDKNMENFCATVYQVSHRDFFEDYQAHTSNPVKWKTCPYPAGSSEIKNYLITDGNFLPAYIPGGEKWKVLIRFLRKGEELGGYNLYAMLRNNASLLG